MCNFKKNCTPLGSRPAGAECRLTSACPKLRKRAQSAKQKTKFLGLPMPSVVKLMKS